MHAWTFRAENQFMPTDFRLGDDPNAMGDSSSRYRVLRAGLDGMFADYPDTAVDARDEWVGTAH